MNHLLLSGYPTEIIAKRFNCSQVAVEKILSEHTDIVEIRRLRREYEKRKAKRDSLLATISNFKNSNRKEIRAENNAAYTWLFKHDKTWLNDVLPFATPRAQRRKL